MGEAALPAIYQSPILMDRHGIKAAKKRFLVKEKGSGAFFAAAGEIG